MAKRRQSINRLTEIVDHGHRQRARARIINDQHPSFDIWILTFDIFQGTN
jgi:hypothetical protein